MLTTILFIIVFTFLCNLFTYSTDNLRSVVITSPQDERPILTAGYVTGYASDYGVWNVSKAGTLS